MPRPLADELFAHALLRGRFVLRSGAVSDRYFDKYRATTHPHLLRALATALDHLRQRVAPDAQLIVAPELGAVPLAAALSLTSDLPFAIVRSAVKEHGTARAIEGAWEPGQRGVLVEDVVTSGGAALRAVEVARSAGIVVEHALCVLDRGGGGAEELALAGAPLHAILTADDLDAAFDAGLGLEAPATSETGAGT